MVLTLKTITKSYNQCTLLSNVNITFDKCGMYFIKGISGSGKTTLLSIIAGIEKFDKGERIIDDDATLSYIFQNFELINTLNIHDNIYLPQYLYNNPNNQKMIIEKLGLTNLLDHYPYELSHGQRQRVAIARSLMLDSDIILCDEPTESLDKTNKDIVMNLLKELSHDHIVIVVTHEDIVMESYYDYLYEIKDAHLVLAKEKDEFPLKQIHPKTFIPHLPSFIKIFLKIIYKKHLFYASFLIVLITLLMTMFQLRLQFFDYNQTKGTLDDHVLYVQEMRLDKIDSIYKENCSIRYKIPVRPELYVNNKKVDLSLTSIPVYYDTPKFLLGNDTGIVINQFASQKIQETLNIQEKDILNKKLEYSCGNITMETPISGIIYENESFATAQAYYHYDEIADECQKTMTYVNNTEMSFYDSLRYRSQYEVCYELNIHILDKFKDFQDNPNFIVTNSYLETLTFQGQQNEIVQVAFLVIILVLMIVIGLYVTITTYQQFQKDRYYFSILEIFGIKKQMISKTYILFKIILFMIILGISLLLKTLLFQPLCLLTSFITQLEIINNNVLPLQTTLIILVIISLIDIISLFISMILVNQKTIHQTLNDEKDT